MRNIEGSEVLSNIPSAMGNNMPKPGHVGIGT